MDTTNISTRMKENYEKRSRYSLIRRTPVIMRLDGKAFHTFTRKMERPFSEHLNDLMRKTAIEVCEEVQGAKCAYVQSDEISILITDYDKLTTDAWFDYSIQKMVSISAAVASVAFNAFNTGSFAENFAYFDSRVFNIPREEVNNYFVWRQQDWKRNSIQLAGQSVFSHKQMMNKNTNQVKEMLLEKDICWEHYEDKWKNGSYAVNNESWHFMDTCPSFQDMPHIVNNLVNCDKE